MAVAAGHQTVSGAKAHERGRSRVEMSEPLTLGERIADSRATLFVWRDVLVASVFGRRVTGPTVGIARVADRPCRRCLRLEQRYACRCTRDVARWGYSRMTVDSERGLPIQRRVAATPAASARRTRTVSDSRCRRGLTPAGSQQHPSEYAYVAARIRCCPRTGALPETPLHSVPTDSARVGFRASGVAQPRLGGAARSLRPAVAQCSVRCARRWNVVGPSVLAHVAASRATRRHPLHDCDAVHGCYCRERARRET